MKKVLSPGRPRAFVCVFFAVFLCSLLVVGSITRYKVLSETSQMEYLAASKSNEIIEAIYALLYKAEALSTLVIQGNGEIRDLERIAPIIINSPVIRNILLAPDGVVERVYPLETNRPLLGYNLLGPGAGNEEALLAREKGMLTLGGPFTAMQGGEVLVGRLPVFSFRGGERTFWGLVSVTLNYPAALNPVRLDELENLGFACEIWRISPDNEEKQIILRTSSQALENPIEKKFNLLNAHWMISISPLSPWYKSLSFYAMLGAAVLVSLLTATIAQNYWEMRQIRSSLELMAMYDSLTGLPNRRAAFERLEDILRRSSEAKTPFVLGYLDLNDFKEINDTHGHHIGDHVLKETAQRIKASLPKEHFVGRIGGDEFIFMMMGEMDEAVQATLDRLKAAMSLPFAPTLVESLHTSLSVGMAAFPMDGVTSEELTLHADAAMYQDKERHRRKERGHRKDMTALVMLTKM